ncbi:MAG: von Willebrand factor type A domain-containing protein [Rhodobacterales bacterium]|nr:von Willebrand factor type A domain-containing protein [Rhodobacterales bacterium]
MSDFDDLDDLKSAMEAATPTPDAGKRAENIALAQKNFAALQGSADGQRLTFDGSKTGLIAGVRNMFNGLTTRGALTATTAMAAFGLILVVPQLVQNPTGALPIDAPRILEREAEDIDLAAVSDHVSEPAPVPAPVMEEAGMSQPAPMAPSTTRKQEAPRAAYPAAEQRQRRSVEGVLGGIVSGAPMPNSSPAMDVADGFMRQDVNTEAFPDATANPLKITSEDPVSTFSIDVDTASYAIVRSSLMAGQLPPAQAVRIEEMVNYFPYDYQAPEDALFRQTVTVTGTPWNSGTQIVHIAIQGQMPAITDRAPLNLVFLIDTSGSMNSPDKLPLLKKSLSLMLSKLTPEDKISIVAYAGSSGQVLEPTSASQSGKILDALDRLSAGGGTAGQAGLQQAYSVAAGMAQEGEITRVILATDGDFNVGISDPQALKRFIADKRESGIYLSVLGFGRGNLDDATMQALAQNGNGQAAYIDTLAEAQKVLVDQFSGALFPIANDVKIQVEFNPAQIAEYRLIGYETRILRREDFNNDRVDAGDIGAGHSVTALYEVTPVGSPAQLSDPLRYQSGQATRDNGELGFLKLRYKVPGASQSQLLETPIRAGGEVSDEMDFAMAIAGFGQLLRGENTLGNWDYPQAIALANSAKGTDEFGYRAEAVQLMRLAQSLSQN